MYKWLKDTLSVSLSLSLSVFLSVSLSISLFLSVSRPVILSGSYKHEEIADFLLVCSWKVIRTLACSFNDQRSAASLSPFPTKCPLT